MIHDIGVFLRHAIQLERDAARGYEDLAQTMRIAGNRDVQQLFDRMAHFSRLHLADAVQRGGFHDLPDMEPGAFQWPDGTSPESATWQGIDGLIDVAAALHIALEGEMAGHRFYATIADSSPDPEVQRMAREFAGEEAEHVEELQRWIERVAV